MLRVSQFHWVSASAKIAGAIRVFAINGNAHKSIRWHQIGVVGIPRRKRREHRTEFELPVLLLGLLP